MVADALVGEVDGREIDAELESVQVRAEAVECNVILGQSFVVVFVVVSNVVILVVVVLVVVLVAVVLSDLRMKRRVGSTLGLVLAKLGWCIGHFSCVCDSRGKLDYLHVCAHSHAHCCRDRESEKREAYVSNGINTEIEATARVRGCVRWRIFQLSHRRRRRR